MSSGNSRFWGSASESNECVDELPSLLSHPFNMSGHQSEANAAEDDCVSSHDKNSSGIEAQNTYREGEKKRGREV